MRLAFWGPPVDETVTQIMVMKASAQAGVYAPLALIDARDPYNNWITHYEDDGESGEVWYQVQYLKPPPTNPNALQLVGLSKPRPAGVPYQITPQAVLDTIQGIPMSRVTAELVQTRIRQAVAAAEQIIRMKLSRTTVTEEPYSAADFRRIVGNRMGQGIRLRHFPVIAEPSIVNPTNISIYYRVRGGILVPKTLLENLDIQVLHHDSATGYNRGVISVYPRNTSLQSIFASLRLTDAHWQHALNLLIDYEHGWLTWPYDIEQTITEMVAADIMEIAGEAETAGLSSRSVDGYSESYTASATTTIFSARRIYYNDKAKKTLEKYWRKPLVA